MRVEVGNAAIESLDRMKEESKRATLQLVDMECGYLTVEFFRKLPQDIEKGGNPTHSIFDRYNDAYLRRVGKLLLLTRTTELTRWQKLDRSVTSELAGPGGVKPNFYTGFMIRFSSVSCDRKA